MKTAEIFAELSHARRLHVGAIVVKDDRIISIGYNGMPAGWDNNCEEEVVVAVVDGVPQREIKELIDYLVEDGHIKPSSKITPSRQKVTSMELEHMEVCNKLSSVYTRMNNEECDILKQIASKY